MINLSIVILIYPSRSRKAVRSVYIRYKCLRAAGHVETLVLQTAMLGPGWATGTILLMLVLLCYTARAAPPSSVGERRRRERHVRDLAAVARTLRCSFCKLHVATVWDSVPEESRESEADLLPIIEQSCSDETLQMYEVVVNPKRVKQQYQIRRRGNGSNANHAVWEHSAEASKMACVGIFDGKEEEAAELMARVHQREVAVEQHCYWWSQACQRGSEKRIEL